MRTKLIKIIYHKFELKDEIENKLNFDKKAKKEKKIEIKKIKLKKQNTINLDRMMKLKTNKTFTKRQRKEFKKSKE
jgi:hypothetical protein